MVEIAWSGNAGRPGGQSDFAELRVFCYFDACWSGLVPRAFANAAHDASEGKVEPVFECKMQSEEHEDRAQPPFAPARADAQKMEESQWKPFWSRFSLC